MPTVYFAHTGPELEGLFYIVQKQAHDLGLALVRMDSTGGMAPVVAAEIAREAFINVDMFIAILGARRFIGVEGPLSPSLTEIEIDTAIDAKIPMAVFAPRPGSEIEMYLRRWAFAQNDAEREAYEVFLRRIEQQINIIYYDGETDLATKVSRVLGQPHSVVIRPEPAEFVVKTYPPEVDVLTPPPAPAPAIPSRSRESADLFTPQTTPPLDIDALAEAIAEKTAARLHALQLEDQEDVARRAVEYAEALRMRPGDLIFGRPSEASQFKSDAFMIMPFNPAFDGVYRTVVQPLFRELSLTVKRGDEFTSARGSIMSEVWAALNACRFVIADITGGNDNVFYELGIAHTLNKPTLLITQARTPEEVPFDLRHLRYIAYENTLAGADSLRVALRDRVNWLLNELKETWEMPSA